MEIWMHEQPCLIPCIFFTKWSIWLVYLVLHLDSFAKRLNSFRLLIPSRLRLEIFHFSLFGVYYFLVIANAICNLKFWVWYQIKALVIVFEMRQKNLTSNVQNCACSEWFPEFVWIVWWYGDGRPWRVHVSWSCHLTLHT
jgi:hypothetical protein